LLQCIPPGHYFKGGAMVFELAPMPTGQNYEILVRPPEPRSMSAPAEKDDVGFIRLLFAAPVEEEIAHRWAVRLARVVGPQVQKLRPDTTMDEMLKWGAAANADPMDFVVIFEPELRMELAEFLDKSERATFRDMVQHYVNRAGRLV
jgi:hypothetical protein